MAFSTRNICKEQRSKIYQRDNFCCVYCGSKFDLSLDHVKPYDGKNDTNDNLVCACMTCNNSKGNLSLDIWLNKQIKQQKIDLIDKLSIQKYILSLREVKK